MAVKDINDLSFEELKSQYINERAFMFNRISELQQANAALSTENKDLKDDNVKKAAYIEKIEQEKDTLKETNIELQNNVEGLSQQLMKLNEEYQLLKAAKYQSQQNKLKISDQLSLYDIPGLFNEAEIEAHKAQILKELLKHCQYQRVRIYVKSAGQKCMSRNMMSRLCLFMNQQDFI